MVLKIISLSLSLIATVLSIIFGLQSWTNRKLEELKEEIMCDVKQEIDKKTKKEEDDE